MSLSLRRRVRYALALSLLSLAVLAPNHGTDQALVTRQPDSPSVASGQAVRTGRHLAFHPEPRERALTTGP